MAANPGGRPRGEGGTGGGGGKSWAELLGSSLPSSLNKNVLEVVLEKMRGDLIKFLTVTVLD